MTFAEKQEQYAKLLVKLGVNIQPEQELVVRCAAEAAPLRGLLPKRHMRLVRKRLSCTFGTKF